MTGNEPTIDTPLELGNLRLRNRFVSAPMERNYCEIDGTMTEHYIDYLARRARGGTALVFTEASYVRADGKGRLRQMGVDVDERIPGITRLAEAVHAEGSLLGVELNHGGRTAQGAVSGYAPVAPTAIPCHIAGGEMPQVLDTADVYDLVDSYAQAADRCKRAGVDVLSLHGGHGYLIHQFLSSAYNQRTDEFADPVRFLNLVIAAVRRAAPNLAIGLRFSAFEGVDGGLDATSTLERMRSVDTASLDFLDVSAGNYEAGEWIVQPGEWQPGILAPYASAYREFGLPIGVAGRINSPETATQIIGDGDADFVTLARTLHADPDFPTRAMNGQRYRPCIACNYCIDSLGTGEAIPCTVNPWVEPDTARPADAVTAPTSIRIIGAGPSGLATARELAGAGASVEVHDARPRIGGDFALASELHEYPEYGQLITWYRAELHELGVPVHLNSTVRSQDVTQWTDVDAVILATGGHGFDPDLPRTGPREVLDVREWLASGREAPEQTVVYGADREGTAVADDLAARGSHVTLIGPQPTIAADVGRRAKIVLVPRLLSHPAVNTHLGATIIEVSEQHLLLRQAGEQKWIPSEGPVLVSMGVEPRRDLLAACRELAPPLGVHLVGDAGAHGGSVHMANVTATSVAGEIRMHAVTHATERAHPLPAPSGTGR